MTPGAAPNPPAGTWNPGDIILTGINAQALVSQAIKRGSVLRYQPATSRIVAAAEALLVAAAVVLAIVLGWSLLGALAGIVVALVLCVVVAFVLAGVLAQRHAFWARYSHAALVTRVEPDGTVYLTEALERGVAERPFAYREGDYTHISVPMSAEDRQEVLAFARDVVKAREHYGFVLFASLAVYCLTATIPGPTLVLMESGTAICSGFVCDALTRAGIIWPHEPYWMMPADIAAHFKLT